MDIGRALIKKNIIVVLFLFSSLVKSNQFEAELNFLSENLIHRGSSAQEIIDRIYSTNSLIDSAPLSDQVTFYMVSSQLLAIYNPNKSQELALKGLQLASSRSNASRTLLFKSILLNVKTIQGQSITTQEIEDLENDLLSEDSVEKAYVLLYLSRGYQAIDEFYKQLTSLNRGLNLLKKMNVQNDVVDKLKAEFNNEFGTFYIVSKEYTKAEAFYKRSLELFNKINNKSRVGMLYFNLGLLYKDVKNHSKAIDYFLKVIEIKKKLKEPYGLGLGYMLYSNSEYQLGNYPIAKEYIELGINELKKANATKRLKVAYLYRAKIAMALNDKDQASNDILRALEYNKYEQSDSKNIKFYQEVFVLLKSIDNDSLKRLFLEHVFILKSKVLNNYSTMTIKRVKADSKLLNITIENNYLSQLATANEKNSALQERSNIVQKYWIFGLLGITCLLIISVIKQLKTNKKNKHLANRDSLTGLMNRRAYFHALQNIYVDSFTDNKRPYLLLLDIDDFKLINDKYGHSTGDKVLSDLGLLLQNIVGANGQVARIGGEEFAIIHYADTADTAIEFCQKVVMAVFEAKWNYGEGELNVTISLGVSKISKNIPLEDIFNEADQCMYKAKSNGRNRMVNNFTKSTV